MFSMEDRILYGMFAESGSPKSPNQWLQRTPLSLRDSRLAHSARI